MIEVLEQPTAPPIQRKRSLFTAANAAEMARRSHAPTSARFRAIPEPEPQAQPATLPATAEPQDSRLELLSEQIARTRDSLNDDDCDYCEHCKRSGLQPHHRAALLRAMCDLLDQQRIAKGEPLPGSRRPGPDKASKRDYSGPITPTIPACGVAPTTGSMPASSGITPNTTSQ